MGLCQAFFSYMHYCKMLVAWERFGGDRRRDRGIKCQAVRWTAALVITEQPSARLWVIAADGSAGPT
jgi:hypothetical protein